MTSDKIYPGMLIRNCHGDIGWVVGKNKRFLEPHMEWDVEWSSGMTSNHYESDLQIYVNDYLDLEKQNGL